MMAESPLEFVFKLATMSERELVGSLRALAADRLRLDQPGLPDDSADTFAGALEALKALHLQNTRRSAPPPPAEQTDERLPPTVASPPPGEVQPPSYDQVREHFAAHEARLRKEALVTDSILERLYRSTAPERETGSQQLSPEDEALGLLRTLQFGVLKHPVAAQSMFAALVSEGRAYARTPEGAALRSRLSRSELLARARITWEAVNLWLLEEQPAGPLPTALLDAFFTVSQHPDLEPMLDSLFSEIGDDV